MIVYVEYLKECTPPKKILEIKNEFRHIAGYKISVKIIVVLYTNKITSQTSQEVKTRKLSNGCAYDCPPFGERPPTRCCSLTHKSTKESKEVK